MSVRLKIILIVLPILIVTLALSSVASSLSARNGITRVAVGFLAFKAQDMRSYLENQWRLLLDNELQQRPEYLEAARRAALSYARSLISSDTELIVAVDAAGSVLLRTGDVEIRDGERRTLRGLREAQTDGWVELSLGGVQRVGHAFRFEPFGWLCLVTEQRATFFRAVREITVQNGVILAVSAALSVLLLAGQQEQQRAALNKVSIWRIPDSAIQRSK